MKLIKKLIGRVVLVIANVAWIRPSLSRRPLKSDYHDVIDRSHVNCELNQRLRGVSEVINWSAA